MPSASRWPTEALRSLPDEGDLSGRPFSGVAEALVVLVDVVAVEEVVEESAVSSPLPDCAVTDVLVITMLAVFAVTPPSGLASTELAVSIDEVVVTTTPGVPVSRLTSETKLDFVDEDVDPVLGSGWRWPPSLRSQGLRMMT
ncbi:hypothetical protein MRX96_010863 [Rhipicephalus microplus]